MEQITKTYINIHIQEKKKLEKKCTEMFSVSW